MLGAIIGGIVVILIGVAIYPIITEQVTLLSLSNESASLGASAEILSLLPLIFILGIVLAALSMVLQGLKRMGILGSKDEEDEDDEEEDEDDDEDDEILCGHCGKKAKDYKDDEDNLECEKCGIECCDDCNVFFKEDDISICKKCLGKRSSNKKIKKEIQKPQKELKEKDIIRSKYD